MSTDVRATPSTISPPPRQWPEALVPVALAALSAAFTALLIKQVSLPLGAAALFGIVAVVLIRAYPLASVVVICLIRASLEGFSLHTVTRVVGVQLSPPDLLTLAFVLGAGLWLLTRIRNGTFDWTAPTLWPAVGLFVVAGGSLLYSTDWALGARDLVKLLGAYCAYLVIVNAKPDPRKLKLMLGLIVASAVVPIVVGWIQFTSGVGKPGELHGGLRVQGTFDHPNTYGFYLVSILAAAWGLGAIVKSPAARRLVGVMALTCFVSLFITLSRNSWGAAVLLVLTIGWRRRRVLVAAGIACTAVLMAMPRVIVRAFDLFQPRSGANRGNSLVGRLDLWNQDFSLWQSSPLLGHGWGSTQATTGAFTHNDFLRALVEAGLLGFIVFVLFLGAMVRASWRAARGRRDLPLAFFGLSLGYVLVSLASNNLGKGAFQFYFWALAGITFVWAQVPPKDEREPLAGRWADVPAPVP